MCQHCVTVDQESVNSRNQFKEQQACLSSVNWCSILCKEETHQLCKIPAYLRVLAGGRYSVNKRACRCVSCDCLCCWQVGEDRWENSDNLNCQRGRTPLLTDKPLVTHFNVQLYILTFQNSQPVYTHVHNKLYPMFLLLIFTLIQVYCTCNQSL